MRKFRDLTGLVFGRLTVDARAGAEHPTKWICTCTCKKETSVEWRSLTSGNTRSCGCLSREKSRERTTHGYSRRGGRTPEFCVYTEMKMRCGNARHPSFASYGGRGISVCARWREGFVNFLSDMGERPSKKHSIERRNNDGDYCPENCRWATIAEQNRNKRNNVFVTLHGQRMIFTDAARRLGLNVGSARVAARRLGDHQAAIDCYVGRSGVHSVFEDKSSVEPGASLEINRPHDL